MGAAAAGQGVQMAMKGTGAGLQGLAHNKHGGGMKESPEYAGPSLRMRLFNQASQDILNEERGLVEDALSQNAAITPEMYRALGFEPIVEDRSGDISALSKQRDDLATQLAGVKKQKGKKANQLRKQLAGLDNQLGSLRSMPGRVVGLKKMDTAPDPTGSAAGSYRQAFDLENETLVRALQGQEPLDPTLMRSLDEEERKLRENLRRQMGPDFETSTAGEQAMDDFKKKKAEALATWNRNTIETYSGLTQARAESLSGLTTEKLKQLSYPSSAQIGESSALGDLAKSRTAVAALNLEGRKQQLYQEPYRDSRVMGAFGAALSAGFS